VCCSVIWKDLCFLEVPFVSSDGVDGVCGILGLGLMEDVIRVALMKGCAYTFSCAFCCFVGYISDTLEANHDAFRTVSCLCSSA
jgi:hypothetical protein